MARAMLVPEAQHGGDRKSEKAKSSLPAELETVSRGYLSMARYVPCHDESLAQSVISGAVTLNAAYDQSGAAMRTTSNS